MATVGSGDTRNTAWGGKEQAQENLASARRLAKSKEASSRVHR